MIWGMAMLLAGAQPAPAQEAPPIAVPADWATMPPLPWRVAPALSPPLAAFVADEVRAGRCTAPPARAMTIEVAVFVRAGGGIRAAVPRAIDCPTVEQFAAGLVTSVARNNLRQPAAGWYRAVITLDWKK